MKKNIYICSALILSLALPTNVALAKEPNVSTDEAVYVNLDYYGAPSDISVVKSCSLNKVRKFMDYGAYRSVSNMSNLALPILTPQGVKWDLSAIDLSKEKNPERFYYECKLKDNTSIVLPWNFDVSYKLNGVPQKAEDLAGASGLIEMNIHAIPNEKADPYYKNNMVLQVGTMIDMDDTLSVEAPGSQLQSIGTYKAVMFMALPGEDIDFTIRIGSKSFENSGITMMMVPGTLSQLEDVKELKESKDKIEDAANAVKDSVDDIIGTMESMTTGLKTTQSGLGDLDQGRATFHASRDEIYENSDEALKDLTNLTDNLNELIPHFKNGQYCITEVNDTVTSLVDTLRATKSNLREYQQSIEKIQANIKDIQKNLTEAHDNESDRQDNFTDLNSNLDDLEESLDDLGDNSKDLENQINAVDSSSSDTRGSFKDLTSSAEFKQLLMSHPELLPFLSDINDISNSAGDTMDRTSDLSRDASKTLHEVSHVVSDGSKLVSSTRELLELGDNYFTTVENSHENIQALLTQANEIGSTTDNLLSKTKDMINRTSELNDTITSYETATVDLLQDTQDLTFQMNQALSSTLGFLTSLQATLRYSGESMNSGTQKTLNGMIDVVEKALEGIQKTSNIKNANALIKETIDNELDRFEEETNVLSMDFEQPKVSFTSNKNPEPESIQIVLRTEEISIDDDDNLIDLEKDADNIGVIGRIKNVFHKMWSGITSMFQ